MNKIKIGIAEDYELERTGLIALLSQYDDLDVVADAPNGKELLTGLKKKEVDIVLLDIEMPVMGGRETFERIARKYPNIKIIMLTEHYTDSYMIEFMKKGAASYLSKNIRIEKLAEAIRKTQEHGRYIDNTMANVMNGISTTGIPQRPEQGRPDLGLTVAEIQVLRLVCMGKTNEEICGLLHISKRTVETHRRNISLKIGIYDDLVKLIDFAVKNNLLTF